MNTYMISFDLHAPTINRNKVEDSIKSLGNWCKYLTTTFLVSSSKSINEVQNIVTKNLDSNDKMIVCKVQKPIVGYLQQSEWDWIHKYI